VRDRPSLYSILILVSMLTLVLVLVLVLSAEGSWEAEQRTMANIDLRERQETVEPVMVSFSRMLS